MDRYGDAISVQLNTAGMDKLREPLFEAMDRLADVNALVCAVTPAARGCEGLSLEVETLRGDGTEIELVENGLPFVTPSPKAKRQDGSTISVTAERCWPALVSLKSPRCLMGTAMPAALPLPWPLKGLK